VLQCVAVQAVHESYLQISTEGEQPIVTPELAELILKMQSLTSQIFSLSIFFFFVDIANLALVLLESR